MNSSCHVEVVVLRGIVTSVALVISWVQAHAGAIALVLGALSFLATLFKPSLWRRLVFTVAVGIAGALFGLYEPIGRAARAERTVFSALLFIAAFWWVIGQYEKWRTKVQPLPRQAAGTFETVADTVRQIVADSGNTTIEANLSSKGNTLVVKKSVTRKKN